MTETTPIRTGGYVDAFCSKCNMDLGHTVIAMVGRKVVKVHCNTCGADHAFRGNQPVEKITGTSKPRQVVLSWEDRMKGRNMVTARRYSAKEHFQADEVILHTTFGLGLVTANRTDKIDVSFRDYDKTLVNGKPQ